ncbi:hypothetical protein AVEN_190874-1 [Araneus ventricosus]|uniref:Uncharacterized protein n=1 Tax=Araneus ventricosus TaxID=182803 RepID=A0A4Y2CTR2_ARAVE|nr:hypothetical protein AVEN_190874-1 [Araneus ventricosus]
MGGQDQYDKNIIRHRERVLPSTVLFIVTDVERFLSRKQEKQEKGRERATAQKGKKESGKQSRYLIVDLQKIPLLKFPGLSVPRDCFPNYGPELLLPTPRGLFYAALLGLQGFLQKGLGSSRGRKNEEIKTTDNPFLPLSFVFGLAFVQRKGKSSASGTLEGGRLKVKRML